MITLQSIRIRNFRAIAEATFKPLEEGITGIVGANGAGKTTFLSATMWALFGVLPPEASLGSLRREGSTGECSVSVVFKHLTQQIEIVREIKSKSNRIVVNIYLDGIPQTVASVTAANSWITTRLGVDANGFLTAFVVRQKELDQLITARPAERKAIIERLAGVDTINAALKNAREDENQSKRLLGVMTGSESDVLEAENNMNLIADKFEQISVNRKALFDQQQQLIISHRSQQATLNSLQEYKVTQARAGETLYGLQRESKDLTERRQALAYVADFSGDTGAELATLRERHIELNSKLKEMSTSVNNDRVAQRSAEIELNNVSNRIAEVEDIRAQNADVDVQTDHGVTMNTLREENKNFGERRAILTNTIRDMHESIKLLGHSTECPTCHTELADPHKLVTTFEQVITESRAELEKMAELIENNNLQLGQLERLATTQAYIKAALAEEPDLKKRQEGLDQLKKTLQETIADQESQAYQLEQELEEVKSLGLKARNLEEDRKAFIEVERRIAENYQHTLLTENDLQAAEAALKEADFDTVSAEVKRLQQQIDENAPVLESSANERGNIERNLAIAKQNYSKASDMWNRKRDMLKDQERLALTSDLLNRFRSDTIASLAPEISDYASELISDMTNGEFTEIKLDDQFEASVVTSIGVERPVTWLSGGELSAVALALRIGIGQLISGGSPELLWADEVLTAQDAERRSSMLSLIRSLPIDQIIMINHSEGFADILDKTITVTVDRKNGSYIADPE
jgi:exonuclease SbcC